MTNKALELLIQKGLLKVSEPYICEVVCGSTADSHNDTTQIEKHLTGETLEMIVREVTEGVLEHLKPLHILTISMRFAGQVAVGSFLFPNQTQNYMTNLVARFRDGAGNEKTIDIITSEIIESSIRTDDLKKILVKTKNSTINQKKKNNVKNKQSNKNKKRVKQTQRVKQS